MHQTKDSELKATMVNWAITGVAMQWNREKRISAEELVDIVLPNVHIVFKQAGDPCGENSSISKGG